MGDPELSARASGPRLMGCEGDFFLRSPFSGCYLVTKGNGFAKSLVSRAGLRAPAKAAVRSAAGSRPRARSPRARVGWVHRVSFRGADDMRGVGPKVLRFPCDRPRRTRHAPHPRRRRCTRGAPGSSARSVLRPQGPGPVRRGEGERRPSRMLSRDLRKRAREAERASLRPQGRGSRSGRRPVQLQWAGAAHEAHA